METVVNQSLKKRQDKFKKPKTDLQTIFYFLQEHVATVSMVAYYTNVNKQSITRYKRDLELSGLLFEVEKKPCKITGNKAWYLTANKSLIHSNNTKLYNNGKGN